METIGPANRLTAVNARPPRITLTALAVINIISEKAFSHMVYAADSHINVGEDFGAVEKSSNIFVVAGG